MSVLLDWIVILNGRKRYFFGSCPQCNSSAPYLYECPVCEYTYPITPNVDKSLWWQKFMDLSEDERKKGFSLF
jgi:hypothetical protein